MNTIHSSLLPPVLLNDLTGSNSTAAQDLGSSLRDHARDLLQLDAEPGAAARQGESESLIFHLTGFPGDVQELSRHSDDVRSTAWSADIWTAAFHEAVEKVGEDIDQAIIKGKDAEQLLKELERLDMDSNQRSAFSRGHEFLKTLQVPLQTSKMGLDLASPFTAIEPTTSVVVGLLRAVTAVSGARTWASTWVPAHWNMCHGADVLADGNHSCWYQTGSCRERCCHAGTDVVHR